jgi:hypothetical protein
MVLVPCDSVSEPSYSAPHCFKTEFARLGSDSLGPCSATLGPSGAALSLHLDPAQPLQEG